MPLKLISYNLLFFYRFIICCPSFFIKVLEIASNWKRRTLPIRGIEHMYLFHILHEKKKWQSMVENGHHATKQSYMLQMDSCHLVDVHLCSIEEIASHIESHLNHT